MKIAVHNGEFHADEVFATAILKLIYPDLKVIRTRDENEFNKADMRIDIGLKYDASTNDYDHHQPEGAGKRANGIPYASAGLIWKHFGKKLANEEEFQHIDKRLIQPIDAGDNGMRIYTSDIADPYTIRDIIANFNPEWDEGDDFDNPFDIVVEFAIGILQRELKRIKAVLKAKGIVRKAIADSNKEYIILDRYYPWKDAVIYESDKKIVIFKAADGDWWVRCVPIKPDLFEYRIKLPSAWAGLKDDDLAKASGVEDAVFCHRHCFIGGAKSKEGAIRMAEIALSN